MKRTFLLRFLLSAGLPLFVAISSSAQSGDVTISTNTTWPAGTYNLTSLRVTSGATLTLQGANTSAQVSGKWAGYGVTINAGSVQVDVGSAISADGQGYLGGETGGTGRGPGGGGGSIFYDAAGGSYGGLGYSSPTLSAGSIYGLALTPSDLGSGGGGATRCAGGECYSDPSGGNGGGAIRLIVSGTLTLNGTISANGAAGPPNWPPSLDNYAGGGSGGSVWVTTGTLTGSGTFTANGGPRYWNGAAVWPAGSGGRIAVYYGTGNGFTGFDTATTNGGPGAQQGTTGFFDTTTNSILVTGSQKFPYDEDSTLTFKNITVRGGGTLTIGGGTTVTASGLVWITGNSNLVLQGKNTKEQVSGAWAGQGVTLSAANVQVDAGSAITAAGQGYWGGPTTGNGRGPGGAGGSMFYEAAGGSYGGLGFSSQNLNAGPTYGDPLEPVDLGSGGGGATRCAGGMCYSDPAGGNGGGAIRLIVTGTLTNNGAISADGIPGPANWPPSLDNYAGGGSGGSIWANIGTLTGSGTFTANGGPRYWDGQPTEPSGGGGRIAIYYTTNSFNANSITANAGASGAKPGTVTFAPSSVQISVDTNPPNLSFSVDGTPYTSLQTFTWDFGSQHTLISTTPQSGTSGTRYVFSGWSDGTGTASNTITASTSTASYTANFTAQYLLTTTASPSSNGSVAASPSSTDGYYNSGQSVQLTATPAAGYVFSNWSGDLNGTTSPQSVTMDATHSVTANFGPAPTPDFNVATASGGTSTVTVTAGSTANYSLAVTGANGFSGSVTLACSGTPIAAACTVTPSPLNVSGSAEMPFTLRVTTTARTSSSILILTFGRLLQIGWMAALCGLCALVLMMCTAKRRRLTFATTVLCVAGFAGCSGGGQAPPPPQQGTPAGTYTVAVTATSGTLSHQMTVTLKVN